MKKIGLLLTIVLVSIWVSHARYYCDNLCRGDAQNLLRAWHYYLDWDWDWEACEWSSSCYNYSSTPSYNYVVTCWSNQCKLNWICFNKPSNASCASNWTDAWLCNSWYYESWSTCYKDQQISPTKKITVPVSQVSKNFAKQNWELLKWMYNSGLTKYNTRSKFRPFDSITRWESSKFLTAYGWYLSIVPEYTLTCAFNDVAWYDYTLTPHIQKACQMGMVKWHNWNYYPHNNITKWEALAVVLRPFVWLQDESVTPRYKNYYNIWYNIWFTRDSIWSFDEPISRFELGNRMYDTIVYYIWVSIWASNDNDFWNISCQVKYPWTKYNPINQMCECSGWRLLQPKEKSC